MCCQNFQCCLGQVRHGILCLLLVGITTASLYWLHMEPKTGTWEGRTLNLPLFSWTWMSKDAQGLAQTCTAIRPSMALRHPVSQSIHGVNRCCQQLRYDQKQEAQRYMKQCLWTKTPERLVLLSILQPTCSLCHERCQGTNPSPSGGCSRHVLCRLLPLQLHF